MTASSVSASAPGKVNLFFAVGPLGADGYHQVVSIYQALNLREAVTVNFADSWQVAVSGSIPEEQLAQVPTDEGNLVVRAAKALLDHSVAGHGSAVNFHIFKNVPVAGGMGGGSADAAAALMAVSELANMNLNQEQLHRIASELGADVPFSLLGGTAVGTGHGTELTQIEKVKPLNWVLVTNPKGLSTPSVYRKLDEMRSAKNQDPTKVATPVVPQELIAALQSGDAKLIAKLLHNDLQEAAVALMPELAETMNAGIGAGALAAMVSGSGPTVALLALDKNHADSIASVLIGQGHSAIATDGPAMGTLIESN